MASFHDLKFIELGPPMNGVQARIHFKNGYGASVVRHDLSYGGDEGLYELAVLDSDGKLTYDTPITSDVLGYLSEDEVSDILSQIEKL